MMMVFEESFFIDNSYIATEIIAKGRIVTLDSNLAGSVKYPTAQDGAAIGVAVTEATASGDVIRVVEKGYVKVKAFASASILDLIAVRNTAGEVYAPVFNTGITTGDYILGHYIEAPAASGDIVTAFIDVRRVTV